MKQIKKNNAFAVAISVIIIALLILAGPAQGFILSLSSDKTSVVQGETIKITAEVDIATDERLPVDMLALKLTGPKSTTCNFDIDGNILSGCEGMTIKRTSYPRYDYGYGYGYFDSSPNSFGYGYGFVVGKLTYEIILDTTNYLTGTYQTKFEVKIGNKTFTISGAQFTIKSKTVTSTTSDTNKGCYTSWVCSDWSPCTGGLQNRTCQKDVSYCYAKEIPEITQVCSENSLVDLSGTNNGRIILENETTSDIRAALGSIGSRITGAVIGISNPENPDSLFFLASVMVTILALLTLLLLVRRARIARARKNRVFY